MMEHGAFFAKTVNGKKPLTIFAKMLHHGFLIGFLNTSLGNTVQKRSKRHLKHFVSFLF